MEAAANAAERSHAVLEQFEPRGPFALARSFRSLVDAHQGRVARAHTTLVPLVEEARGRDSDFWESWLLSTLGFVQFAAGEHAAADRSLTRMQALFEALGGRESVFDRSEPFHIESLLALGEAERARQTLARLERSAALPRARGTRQRGTWTRRCPPWMNSTPHRRRGFRSSSARRGSSRAGSYAA